MKKDEIKIITLPVVPLRGIVLFPDMTLHFDIGRKASLSALKAASEAGDDIFFAAQTDVDIEAPGVDDLFPVGVIGTVRQIIRLPDHTGTIRVVVDGKTRGRISSVTKSLPHICAEIEILSNDYTLPEGIIEGAALFEEAVLFSLRRCFDEYCDLAQPVTPDIISAVYKSKRAGKTSDIIAGNIMLPIESKQLLLAELNIYARCEMLCVMLSHESEILRLDEQLQDKVQQQMDKNQREYYLREEMKAITDELGEMDGDDFSVFAAKISDSKMPEQNKNKLFGELERMKRLSQSAPDAYVLRTYLEKCLDIPWGVATDEIKNIEKAKKILERDHYGLKDVKERIVEMLSALIVSPDIKGQIICLAGPPGVGKTSIAKSIAKATGRKYARISLGGVGDESEIRGHRRTYIGSMPGRVINALIESGSMNSLILLDEVDKLSKDYKGDPSSALLEVLDGEQNNTFNDHYIDMPVDLSRVLFITTANDKFAIPDALRDRMEIIDIPGYTYEEKFYIAKRHLLPKQMKEHGLKRENLKINDAALRAVIEGYTREAGVRNLEHHIAKICRKETVRLAAGNNEALCVTDKNIEDFLGAKKFRQDMQKRKAETGLVNGLAWTSAGGEMLEVEVAVLPGDGKLRLTGSLGDVMKESAEAAMSYVRSRCNEFSIVPDFYKTKDIHIHFPEGAVPKDGPSAGVTIATALVSALTGRRARADVAMTGEITLRGRVLQIGGLREKSMAAYREGIKYVFIPFSNEPDLQEVDEAVKAKITFVPVKHADEIIEVALLPDENKTDENDVVPKSGTVIPAFNSKRRRKGELQ